MMVLPFRNFKASAPLRRWVSATSARDFRLAARVDAAAAEGPVRGRSHDVEPLQEQVVSADSRPAGSEGPWITNIRQPASAPK